MSVYVVPSRDCRLESADDADGEAIAQSLLSLLMNLSPETRLSMHCCVWQDKRNDSLPAASD